MIKKLKQRNSLYFWVATLISISACFFGCKKKEEVAAAPVNAQASQKQTAKPVLKVQSSVSKPATQAQSNQFDFSGKKDPFKPFVAAKTLSTPTNSDIKKNLQDGLPIHSFDVSQFRLIGIVSGTKENQAMVVDPNNKGYVLKIGMTIGKNDGRITSISSSGVDVLEQFKDDNGRVRKENIRITLPRKQ